MPSQNSAAPAIRFEAAGAETPARHGRRLAQVLGCRGCHGADLAGQPWEEDPAFAILYSSNLTRVVSRYDDAALARAIRLGVRPDGSPLWAMPSETFSRLSEPDMAALIAYLRTLRPAGRDYPRMAIGPRGRQAIDRGEIRPAPYHVREGRDRAPVRLDERHDWARYIARATCGECHGLDLSGSPTPDADDPPDLIVAGAYSRAEFRRLLRTGVPTGGRRLALMATVARSRFSRLTDREVDAIYDYLVARARQAH